MPSTPVKRRVTPSASKAASRKRCSSRTVTPHRAAWRRRISSNRSRKTWNVWGVGVSSAAWKSAYCSVPPSGRRKLAPHFLTKPAAAIASSAPSARKTSLLHGSCDSPMWKRGNCSRSSRTTLLPRRLSAVAALEPPGPPPTTATSKSHPLLVMPVCAHVSPPCSRPHHGAELGAVGFEPVEENAHVPADAEVPHSHIEVGPRLLGGVDLHARGHAEAQRGLDDMHFGFLHPRVVPLPRDADAHRVVGGAELHHIHALDREHRLHVLHRRGLLDHHRHHRVLQRLHEGGRAHVHHMPHVAAHAVSMDAAGGGCLRPHGAHALAHVVHRARVGEEHVLDAGTDGAHREIGARLLLDLHH